MTLGEAIVASGADRILPSVLGVWGIGWSLGPSLRRYGFSYLGFSSHISRLCVTPNICTLILLIPEGEVNELKGPQEEALYLLTASPFIFFHLS